MRRLLDPRSKYYLLIVLLTAVLLTPPFRQAIRKSFLFIDHSTRAHSKNEDVIDKLKRENLLLSLRLDRLGSLEKENIRLRKALELEQERKVDILAADVISFSPIRWQRSCFVNVGTEQGISDGMYVLDEEKHLLGRIRHADRTTSHLVLLEDPEFSAPVKVDGQVGLLQGSLSGPPKILYIETNTTVNAGDAVDFWHPDYNIRLPVGTVKQVKLDSNDLFLFVQVQPYGNFENIRQVFIVK